jgi:hypothetical protein
MKNPNLTFNDKDVKINGTNITIKRDEDIMHNCF